MWTWLRRSMRGLLRVALFASNQESSCLRYFRVQTLCGRAADALVHSPMRSNFMIALYAQTVYILAVSLNT